MQRRVFGCVLVAAWIAGISGCGAIAERGAKEETSAQEVPLSAVPEPARIVIERLTAGGEIKKIEKEELDGKVVYDVEAKVGEKDLEYDVAGDGTVLTAEESVAYASMPGTVQAAAQKYFGSAAGLQASKETEGNRTFYEVQGKKGSAVVTLKLTDTGRIVEEEKE